MAPPSTDRAPFMRPALTVVAAITALRVAALALNHTDLFVDESQYWLWARELEFGYYSKPPLIGWVIRLTTELGQSNSAFWVRLSAPLLHGVTAIFVGALTARFYDRRTADFAAMVYITLPLAAAGSVLISTDTIMLPFLVLALYFYAGILKKKFGVRCGRSGPDLGVGLPREICRSVFSDLCGFGGLDSAPGTTIAARCAGRLVGIPVRNFAEHILEY